MDERARRVMERARDAGYIFSDSDTPGEAIEKVCQQLGIDCKDSDSCADKIEEVDAELLRRAFR